MITQDSRNNKNILASMKNSRNCIKVPLHKGISFLICSKKMNEIRGIHSNELVDYILKHKNEENEYVFSRNLLYSVRFTFL